jgi:hypothetical protein
MDLMKNPNKTQQKKNRSSLYISLAIILVSLLLNLTLYKTFILDIDERHMVKRAMSILCGYLPWVDYSYHTYAPGIYLLLALVFVLISPSLIVERFLWVILRCLISVFTFQAARRLMPRSFALIPTIMVMLLPAVYYKSFYSLLILINLLMLLSYVANFEKKWLILTGFVVGFTFWFREDIAAFAAFTCGFCILLNQASILREKTSPVFGRFKVFIKNILKTVGIYAVTVIAAFSPLLIFYAIRSHAYSLLYQLSFGHLNRWFGQRARDRHSFPSLNELVQFPINWDAVFVWLPILLFISLFLVLAHRLLKNKAFSNHDWLLFVTLTFSVLTYFHTIQFPTYVRMLENGAQIFILMGYAIFLFFSFSISTLRWPTKKQSGLSSIKVFILVVLLVFPSWFVYYGLSKKAVNDRISYSLQKEEFIRSEIDVWLREKLTRQRINEVLRVIKNKTERMDKLLYIESGMIYFFEERKNLARQQIILKHLEENDLLSDLQTVNPKCVAVDHWASCSVKRMSRPFHDWFNRHYTYDTNTGRYAIYLRK